MVKEANSKVTAYSKFPLDPYFEHNDLKANPDGVYYKVFGKLSAGNTTSAEAAEELLKGIDECYKMCIRDSSSSVCALQGHWR